VTVILVEVLSNTGTTILLIPRWRKMLRWIIVLASLVVYMHLQQLEHR